MVTVTIDGKITEVPEGTTVLRAAEMAGVNIPTLCDHPNLTPYGGCRLCLVEVEGARTLQPSCTLPVSNNMVVHTDTPKIHDARKMVLTLLFSERNHFCPYCQLSGGDCELQNAAYAEGMDHWAIQPNWNTYAVDASNSYFVLDNNRCILCRRCVRACGELVGNFTLGFEERGAKSFLVADFGVPLGESTCISCGTCVQVCPTGALIDRASAYRGKVIQTDHTETICTGCSVGCTMDVLARNNNLVRIEGVWEAPLNDGVLCKTGRFLPLEERRDRITSPMIRKNGNLQKATWDEALDYAAARLGKGSAAIVSTRLTAEALSLFKQIFSEATSTEEGHFTAASAAFADETGKPFGASLETVRKADAILVVGVDLVAEHEVLGFFVKRILPYNVKLVVVDANAENGLIRHAAVSLLARKVVDADTIHGIIAAISKLGSAKGKAVSYDLTAIAAKTDVPVEDYETAAQILASAVSPVLIFGKGAQTLEVIKALDELSAVLGGQSALLGTAGGANSMAASQYHLDKPFSVKAQQSIFIALADEDPSQKLIQTLEKASFVVVQTSYASQLTASADVVLPVEMWAEQEGHFINLEGRLQETHRSLMPAGEIWSNVAVFKALASRLDVKLDENWKMQLSTRVSAVAILEA